MCIHRTPQEDAINEEMMAEEEAYEVETFSPAGNMLECSDQKVSSVLRNINKRRAHNGLGAVTCSERATGTAAVWSEEMCARCAPLPLL